MNTFIFIVVTFAIIAVVDIYLFKSGKRTITSWFRQWFKTVPLIPYVIGVIFIGHFGVYEWNKLLSEQVSLRVFQVIAVLSVSYFVVEMILERIKKKTSKFYDIMCDFWPLPMTIGVIVGSFWR